MAPTITIPDMITMGMNRGRSAFALVFFFCCPLDCPEAIVDSFVLHDSRHRRVPLIYVSVNISMAVSSSL
ncbi:hypothetical protein BLNAU_22705 [Blattamonas nauphoetae]|uniref:Uncharacterized protein n=1 Tax=Blattamonas nauphoetae TaxID=2049346 RepID=A0ABQ9WS92_9EUKA|nr:hypothetical protein BLNAU_22705 [Blattamonas nauphoetae]